MSRPPPVSSNRRVRIAGSRGRWLAEADGLVLPVIHQTWCQGLNGYLDPMQTVDQGGKRDRDYAEALRSSQLLVIQKDDGICLARKGYVGVFFFDGLVVGDAGSISLTITGRYASPAR